MFFIDDGLYFPDLAELDLYSDIKLSGMVFNFLMRPGMELNIQNETSVKDVQKQFSNYFPFLQIEFYWTHKEMQPAFKGGKVHADEPVKQLMKPYRPLQLKINHDTTVSELQKTFSDIGLNIQVYRKFGTFWIQTSLTDDWTLHRQNNEALILSVPADKYLTEKTITNGRQKEGN